MKEGKNIERLFQEKFKDFEAIPPINSWSEIEAKLKEKKKKRIVPFWFKMSGIAASLVIGSLLYTNYNNTFTHKTNDSDSNVVTPIVDVENNKTVFDSEKKVASEETLFEPKEIKKINKNTIKINLKTASKNNSNSNSNYYAIDKDPFINQKLITENKKEFEQIFEKKKFSSPDANNNSNNTTFQNLASIEKVKDSSLLLSVSEEVAALEKQLLNEKRVGINADEKEKEEPKDKWVVSSNTSPIYFNSASNVSSIDSRFNSNDKQFNTNISYGVGLEYNLSKKLNIRTGVNTLKLDYNTKNIVFNQDVNAKSLENVKVNDMGKLINVESKSNLTDEEVALSGSLLNKYDGEINQKISYIEVPLEMSYSLLDKKFSLDVIGGLSTLLLNDNSISLVSNGVEMNIGEASNLNKVHFSSNVGLGLNYTFFKSFQASLNPMFKYQINTYKDNSGDFKPYFVALYTGISYSF